MTAVEYGGVAGPLSASVASVCRELRRQLSPRTAAGFGEVLRRLESPLQVAVAGRIKSGKSTLVNALIGRRVAPTGIGECTRLVTRFQYGTVDRLEIVLRDGTRRVLPFAPDGMIPDVLGVATADVSHVEVYLTNAVLRAMTVIDTPGLGSLNTAGADSGEELDDSSRGAVAGAEAVLYVLTQGVRADDEQALAAFTAATAGREAGPANAIALLNKADTVAPESVAGAGGDVWTAAGTVARRQAELLGSRVADVVPVIGLIAESVESGGFTQTDADGLRRLAELDDEVLDIMSASADLFASWDCDVPALTRTRLLEQLDLYGVRRCVRAIRAHPEITAGGLRRTLLAESGVDEVRARLGALFAARADGIKAATALASVQALGRASGSAAERGRVHDAVEGLLARPEAHQLRLLEALTLVTSGAVDLPEDLAREVLRLGSNSRVDARLGMRGESQPELTARALERAAWWRSFASLGATPAQSRVAHVVHRAYFLIWQQLRAQR